MRIFRTTLACLAATALVSLSGCLTDFPLTSTASTNIDTRLLGVFEYDQKPNRRRGEALADDEKKVTQRVAVLPRNGDEYLVYHRDFDKKPARTTVFVGWISRVDNDYYLTLEDVTDDSPTRGKFTFLRYEWRWPGNFIVYAPDLKELENVSSYEMRQAVRARLKDDTMFPFEGTYWTKIARVWWDPEAENPAATIPPEFEKGTKRNFPGL